MHAYEAPELLQVGLISGVVLGEKNLNQPDNDGEPDMNHRPSLSVLDVD